MSEAYTYGGNGSKERIEYNELSEKALAILADKVSVEMESIFANAPSSRGVANRFSQDKEGMYRNLTSMYTHENSTLLFDAESGSILNILDAPSVYDVKIEHALYTEGVLREEYIIKLVQADPGTNGAFSTRYLLSHFTGNVWQATVEHIDVEHDDYDEERTQNNSKYYSRNMTSYDFGEFFKDTAQIKDQLGIVLVQ